MGTHQIVPAIAPGYVDKRRSAQDDFETRIVVGGEILTANGAGTTTTIVGANADPANGTNIARIGDEFKLFDSSDVLKEETVFRVTDIAVGASTTVTFTPAADVATASGDYYKLVGISNQNSMAEIDRRLIELGFTQTYIDSMTLNDKQYQIRILDDPGSI